MNLLIISEMFPPTYSAAGLSAARVAKCMLANGHDVRIVARPAARQEAAFEPEDEELQQRTTFVRRRESKIRNAHVRMLVAAMKTGLWEFSAGWVADALPVALDLVRDWRPDVIFSRSEPVSSHLIAYRVSRQTGIPWVPAFGDPWPRFHYPPPYHHPTNPMTAAHWNGWQRRILRQCGMCLFPTEPIRDIMIKSSGLDLSHKAVVIPHIAPARREQMAGHRQDKLTVVHTGAIPDERYPAGLAAGVAQLVQRQPTVRERLEFLFVGRTCEKLRCSFQRESIADMLTCRPPVSYRESLDLTGRAQILLLIEADMSESIFLPSKLVDYVSTGRPILALCPTKGPVASVFAAGGGKVAPPSDADAIGNAINDFYEAWAANALDERFSSQGLYDQFSAETLGPRLIECLERGIQSNRLST